MKLDEIEGAHPDYARSKGLLAELVSHFPIIQNAAPKTQWRFLDFFTATIQNPNTREAYARAVRQFFTYCDLSGVRELGQIKPCMVVSSSVMIRYPTGTLQHSPPHWVTQIS